jgi:hypothetical protein
MKQVNTILPPAEDPGIGDGIKLGIMVGDKVEVERSRKGVGTTVVTEESIGVGLTLRTGGFCQM